MKKHTQKNNILGSKTKTEKNDVKKIRLMFFYWQIADFCPDQQDAVCSINCLLGFFFVLHGRVRPVCGTDVSVCLSVCLCHR